MPASAIGRTVSLDQVSGSTELRPGVVLVADDLALAMRAQRIRIVAPIPGKGAVGIEIPNPRPRVVTMREVLESPAWSGFGGKVPLALGHEIAGSPVVTEVSPDLESQLAQHRTRLRRTRRYLLRDQSQLVSRFRNSHDFYIGLQANFGIGTLANY